MEITQATSLDQLNELTAAHAAVLLIVSRNACPGCVNLARALDANDELKAALADVTVVKVQLEQVPNIAQVFGLRAAPSMVLFKDDDEVSRVVGFQTPVALINALREAFSDVQAVAQAA